MHAKLLVLFNDMYYSTLHVSEGFIGMKSFACRFEVEHALLDEGEEERIENNDSSRRPLPRDRQKDEAL